MSTEAPPSAWFAFVLAIGMIGFVISLWVTPKPPLTTPDDQRAFWGWLAALVLVFLLSFGMSELLTGCATIEAIRNVDK